MRRGRTLQLQLAPPAPIIKIYINGKYFEKEDAKVSVYDHGLLYGDGVFEDIRSYGGKVFRMVERIDRLWDSAKAKLRNKPAQYNADIAEPFTQRGKTYLCISFS